MNATLLPRALAIFGLLALVVAPLSIEAQPVPATATVTPAPALAIPTAAPTVAPAGAPAAAQTPLAVAPLRSEATPLRIAIASFNSANDLASVRPRVRFALVDALRNAFGKADVSDFADDTANVALSAVLTQTGRDYFLAIGASDRGAGGKSFGNVRFPIATTPIVPIARVVALVDRTLAPAPDFTEPPVIAVAPLAAPGRYHLQAAALTNLLATRIGAASGATVRALMANEVNDPAAIDAIRPRVTINGSVVATAGTLVLHLSALANGASQIDELYLPLGNVSTLPGAAAFAPFVAASLDDAPEVEPYGPAFDVAVLPVTSAPGLAFAAQAARAALTDRMVSAGYYARAVDAAPQGASTFSASIARTAAGYEMTLHGRSGTSGANVTSALELSAPAQMPSKAAVAKLVSTTKFAQGPPTNRFVFVPFPDPANNDSYVTFANTQFTAAVQQRGYALVTSPVLDAEAATLAAPQLCRDDDAQGVLVANSIDHDQDYHKGALRTFGSVLGFFTAGIGEALVNGVNGVASDDRYVNHANLAATLLDCNGKTLWHDNVRGENSHVGTNGGNGIGAISDAVGKLAGSMFAAPALR